MVDPVLKRQGIKTRGHCWNGTDSWQFTTREAVPVSEEVYFSSGFKRYLLPGEKSLQNKALNNTSTFKGVPSKP